MAAVVDTRAGPSVVSEDLLPQGWRAQAWRALTRTRSVDALGQALKALARIPLTLHVHDNRMHFPFLVVKRLSVPLMIRCDFRRQCTKAILTQAGKSEWSTGAVADILVYSLGARERQYKAPAKPRVRPNELTLAGATVLPFGTQTDVQVVTWSTGSCLVESRAEFLANLGLHLARGHHKKVRRNKPFSVLLVVVPQSRGLPQKEGSNGRLSRSRDTRYGTRGPGSWADRNAKTSRHGLLAGDDGASHRRRPSS